MGIRPEHISGVERAPADLLNNLTKAAIFAGVTAAIAIRLVNRIRQR
jgi:hypothetical protein